MIDDELKTYIQKVKEEILFIRLIKWNMEMTMDTLTLTVEFLNGTKETYHEVTDIDESGKFINIMRKRPDGKTSLLSLNADQILLFEVEENIVERGADDE